MPPGLYRAKENGITPKHSKSHQRSSDVEDSVSSHLPALPGTRQLVSSCGSRNLYPIPRLTFSSQHAHVLVLCVVFLASTFYNSLSAPSFGLCVFGRAAKTSVSHVWVRSITQRFHISRLIWEDIPEIDPDCKLNGRNFPQCNFWRTLISHLSPERSIVLGLSAFSTQPDCLP